MEALIKRLLGSSVADKSFGIASYIGSFCAIIAGMSLHDWGMLIGIILGIGTFAVNTYFKFEMRRIAEKNSKTEKDE